MKYKRTVRFITGCENALDMITPKEALHTAARAYTAYCARGVALQVTSVYLFFPPFFRLTSLTLLPIHHTYGYATKQTIGWGNTIAERVVCKL